MLRAKPSKLYAALNAFILTGVVILAWTRFDDAPLGFLIPFTIVAAGIAGFGLWKAVRPSESTPNGEKEPEE